MLELKGTDTQAFDDAVEELAKVVNHHLTEEELTILNPAREEVGERVRAELGEEFATERNRQIDDDCGSLTNVRRDRRRRREGGAARRRVTAGRISPCGDVRMGNTVGVCNLPPSPGPRSSGPLGTTPQSSA